jgi:hypothetical protein
MSDLVSAFVFLESSLPYHEARLLLLIKAFKVEHTDEAIEGMTKLAKLDFLLRYPTVLERSLATKHKAPGSADVQDHERLSVESQMVRYRYGPWDHRYRSILNSLIARGLVWVTLQDRTWRMGITPKGSHVASLLAANSHYEIIAKRAEVLKRYFDMKGTHLMRFIYKQFPEITSLRMDEAIDHAHSVSQSDADLHEEDRED